METTPPRLTIVTGKGGVGKTSIALSLTHYYSNLREKNDQRQFFYICFDQLVDHQFSRELNIQIRDLKLIESAEIYMGQKLKSKTVANWIATTQFFNSLLNMLPSFGQLILLGHLIDDLIQNPNWHFIVDSPSSGHTMTMIESMRNFRQIFAHGILIKDIDKMEKFLRDQNLTQVIIGSLPMEMAIEEALELKHFFHQNSINHTKLVVNECLHLSPSLTQSDIPGFLKNKITNEVLVCEKALQNQNVLFLPTIFENSSMPIIKQMSAIWSKYKLQPRHGGQL